MKNHFLSEKSYKIISLTGLILLFSISLLSLYLFLLYLFFISFKTFVLFGGLLTLCFLVFAIVTSRKLQLHQTGIVFTNIFLKQVFFANWNDIERITIVPTFATSICLSQNLAFISCNSRLIRIQIQNHKPIFFWCKQATEFLQELEFVIFDDPTLSANKQL